MHFRTGVHEPRGPSVGEPRLCRRMQVVQRYLQHVDPNTLESSSSSFDDIISMAAALRKSLLVRAALPSLCRRSQMPDKPKGEQESSVCVHTVYLYKLAAPRKAFYHLATFFSISI